MWEKDKFRTMYEIIDSTLTYADTRIYTMHVRAFSSFACKGSTLVKIVMLEQRTDERL